MFDKTKAKRNAERYLSQGKIRSAIEEFKVIVTHDPKDFSTLNILGDLYMKNSDARSAVKCFYPVAEHYSKQGFAAKAIAVYNKISRVEPNSVKVSEKLAELYKMKGSVLEARSHYSTLAEHYRKSGKTEEALAIWEQIALLDPENATVCLTIADEYKREGRIEEAARALVEAGNRYARQNSLKEAFRAFNQALELSPNYESALRSRMDARFAASEGEDAALGLEELLEADPHNREIISLLIDAYIRLKNTAEAEKHAIRLVEIEPASYPKFVELAGVCFQEEDIDSSARLLSIASEHMFAGGQSDEFVEILNGILEKSPENLEALKLMVRLNTWRRDEEAFRQSLQSLAEAARKAENAEDERFALSQLVMVMPKESDYADRLRELNALYGFEDSEFTESLFDKKFLAGGNGATPVDVAEPVMETSAELTLSPDELSEIEIFTAEAVEETEGIAAAAAIESKLPVTTPETAEQRLRKECDSIRFYIDSGYAELAEKAIGELRSDFGDKPEIEELEAYLNSTESADSSGETSEENSRAAAQNGHAHQSGGNTFEDFRNEIGLDDCEAYSGEDFETHFNTAIAYKEMGLLEQAIHEFQEAAAIVKPNDSARCFFSCANLLGHCFLEIGKPNLSVLWFERALETHNLSDEERVGLWYELATAHEAGGEFQKAGEYFEKVYAENINFRDVGERIKATLVAG